MKKISRIAFFLTAVTLAFAALSADVQTQRLQFIAKLQTSGVVQKIEKPAKLGHLWTGRAWNTIAFDDKQAFANVVFAYFYDEDRSADLLVIKDGRSGKRIGTFDLRRGLALD